jgi:hypothetical protein
MAAAGVASSRIHPDIYAELSENAGAVLRRFALSFERVLTALSNSIALAKHQDLNRTTHPGGPHTGTKTQSRSITYEPMHPQ